MNWQAQDIIQAVISVILLGLTAFLLISGKGAPPELYALDGAVVGFFFRSATVEAEKKAAVAAERRLMLGNDTD